MRRIALLITAFALAGCVATIPPRPVVPPNATASEENRILCREARSSPWYVPCDTTFEN